MADLGKHAWEIGGWLMTLLLIGTHLFFTIRTGAVQRFLPRGFRLSMINKPQGEGDITHFGAIATIMAATIGIGNVYGVTSAIMLGGPGAVFWMWISGLFSLATKYSEAVLSVKFRVSNSRGEMSGGPMYVMERALGWKGLAVVFSLVAAVAGFGIGNMTQVNAIVGLFTQTGGAVTQAQDTVVRLLIAIPLTVSIGVILLGGIQWIAKVCQLLVPFMVVFYIVACLAVLFAARERLPDALGLIFHSAFSGKAAVGGVAGFAISEAIRYGAGRSLFCNESGLGSSSLLAAAAQTRNPVRQGIVSATSTFWGTLIVSALTGLVVVSSGPWTEKGHSAAEVCRAAFGQVGPAGNAALTLTLFLFCFTSNLAWAYYGEKSTEYLFGVRAIPIYRWLWTAVIFLGALAPIAAVWKFTTLMNGLMAVPNLICLIAMSRVVVAETRAHKADLTGRADK